jgi:hypothetical protein
VFPTKLLNLANVSIVCPPLCSEYKNIIYIIPKNSIIHNFSF